MTEATTEQPGKIKGLRRTARLRLSELSLSTLDSIIRLAETGDENSKRLLVEYTIAKTYKDSELREGNKFY